MLTLIRGEAETDLECAQRLLTEIRIALELAPSDELRVTAIRMILGAQSTPATALMAVANRTSPTLNVITQLADSVERDPEAQPIAHAFTLGYALGQLHGKDGQR